MLIVALGRIVQFTLLLLTLRLATGLLTPAEMGKVSIVTATLAFFALLLLNPVGMFMNRRLHAWDSKGQVKKYFAYFWRYLLVVSLCAATTLSALTWLNMWHPTIGIYWLLFLVCGNLIFGTVNQVVIPGLNMFGHREWFTVLTVATVATSLIFAVLLAGFVSASAEYWMSGLLAGQLIIGLIGKRIFFGKLHHTEVASDNSTSLSKLHLKYLFRFAWPVAVAVGLGWIQSQGYRYIMADGLGLAELGLFVAGFGISSGLISGFESIFSTYFQPKFYKMVSNDDPDEQSLAWVAYAQAILPALLLTGVFIMAMAPELTDLLLGASYKKSAQFVVWGAMAELARTATAVYGMVAHARMNTKMLLTPNLAGAVTAMLLIWALTPIYGANGVGLGLVLSAIIALLVTAYITRKYLAAVLPLKFFWKSAVMGIGMLLIAETLRVSFGDVDSHFTALVKLFVIGALFMLFQYLMLLPVLKKEAYVSNNPDQS